MQPLLLVGAIALFLGSFYLIWQALTTPPPTIQAAAKSPRLTTAAFAPPYSEDLARTTFEAQIAVDTAAYHFLQAVPLGISESRAWQADGCADGNCAHVTLYDPVQQGTLEGVVNMDAHTLIDTWVDPEARPGATEHTLEDALAIAARDAAVQTILGDVAAAEVMMVPMNIWHLDDGCNQAWCVDLTFHDPVGSGRILHVAVNMHTETVARTFYTRGRDPIPYTDISPQRNAFSDGCHAQGGWEVCWEMTANDGVNFYDAVYEERSIFSSAKVGQVEVWYPSWPGGYRDEIGFASSVPPYFDTEVETFEDGFQISQLFTEFTRWPNCICCYRYEQIMAFYHDGSFEARFISHGPGCDDLSVYQPLWRIDLDLDGAEEDAVWAWQGGEGETAAQWIEVAAEGEVDLIGETAANGEKLATFDDDVHYRWRYLPSDPLGLDEAKLFLLNWNEGEGDNPILPGPANTFEPPRQWLNGDELSESNVVLWYVPLLKTKKGGPWWCMPEPAPDFTPCEAVLRAEPAGPLPSPEELADTAAPTAAEEAGGEPVSTPTGSAGTQPTAEAEQLASIPLIEGETVKELILNAGCTACHVIGDLGEHNKVGPNLTDIGSTAPTRDPDLTGREYIQRSILYPNEFIAPDCPNGPCLANIMPSYYGDRLTGIQLEEMVSYLLEQTGGEVAASTPTPAPIGQTATPTVEIPRISRVIEPSPAGETISFVVWLLFGLGAVFLLILSRRR